MALLQEEDVDLSVDEDGAGVSGDDDGNGSMEPRGKSKAKFTEGDKSASFAKAFAKIMSREVSAAQGSNLILADSSSLKKRKADEDAAERTDSAARNLRAQLKQRGHQKVPVRGEDPQHDQREKQLHKLATKGVVLLFNAVAKAQKSSTDALAQARKSVKMDKKAFLAQLKQTPSGQQQQQGGPGGSVLGLGPPGAPFQTPATGWKVLQDDYTGLTGGKKLKDWDKASSDEDDEDEEVDIGEDDDSEEEEKPRKQPAKKKKMSKKSSKKKASAGDSDDGDDEGWL